MHSSSRLRYDPTDRTLPISYLITWPIPEFRVARGQKVLLNKEQQEIVVVNVSTFLWIGSLGGRPGKTVVCLCGMMQVHCDYSLVATKSLLCNIVIYCVYKI